MTGVQTCALPISGIGGAVVVVAGAIAVSVALAQPPALEASLGVLDRRAP